MLDYIVEPPEVVTFCSNMEFFRKIGGISQLKKQEVFVDILCELGWSSFVVVNGGKWRDQNVAISTMMLQ